MIREYVDLSQGFPNEDDVRAALDYLISIEPGPEPSTHEEYQTAIAPYESQIERALATLRAYAEQLQPASLDDMQDRYYAFTNDPRYLKSSHIASAAVAYLNEAWAGIGPWRR